MLVGTLPDGDQRNGSTLNRRRFYTRKRRHRLDHHWRARVRLFRETRRDIQYNRAFLSRQTKVISELKHQETYVKKFTFQAAPLRARQHDTARLVNGRPDAHQQQFQRGNVRRLLQQRPVAHHRLHGADRSPAAQVATAQRQQGRRLKSGRFQPRGGTRTREVNRKRSQTRKQITSKILFNILTPVGRIQQDFQLDFSRQQFAHNKALLIKFRRIYYYKHTSRTSQKVCTVSLFRFENGPWRDGRTVPRWSMHI